MQTRHASRWSAGLAAAALVVTFGGVVLGTALEARAPASSIKPADFTLIAAFLSLPAVGALLVWRRPGNAVGWLLATMGALGGLYLAAHGWAGYALRTRPGEWPGGALAAWLIAWLQVPTFGLLPFVAATFPSGTIGGPRLRRFGRIAIVALVAVAAAQAFAPGKLDGFDPSIRQIENPAGIAALRTPLSLLTAVGALTVVAFTVAVIANAVARHRAATGDERRQLRGVAVFPALIPGSILLSFALPRSAGDGVIVGGQTIGLFGLSAAMASAVLRHGLYDLGDYVRRTATYVALSAGVVVAVVAVASVVGVLVPIGGVVPATLAAALVALALGPLRARLQRAVDRLLFGARDDPYAVLADVGASLEASLNPTAALQEMVVTLANSLRVPFAAIEADVNAPTVRYGTPVAATAELALVHQHQRVGRLVVGQRSADEGFTEPELRLLRDLSRQIAAAVHSATITEALQLAHRQLVGSREDERRRLRRDIHDGLGPTLAGTMLQLDALRDLLPGESRGADIASTIKENLRLMVDDVRRISHDLRPPALDDLGLIGAVREQAQGLASSALLEIDLDLPPSVPPLSAALEVAVYRIFSEALTNVVRHAGATRCAVRLTVGEQIDLEVSDDGTGVPDGSTPGIGLASMRERATELGGECTIETIEPNGTCVRALLPVKA